MPLTDEPVPSYAAWCCGARSPAAIRFPLAAACALLLAWSPSACAQVMEAPPAESLVHNGADSPQAFPEVVWQLYTGIDSGGYTAQWTCEPFVHSTKSTLKVDARLAIRVIGSDGFANWTAALPGDQTDYASGDSNAAVAAESFAVGDGQVGLTVTFLSNDYSTLAAGDYSTTVVGTITAN